MDSAGYIWAADRSLVYRFDGSEWRAFDLRRYGAPNTMRSTKLVADRDGTIWVLDYARNLLHWKRDSTVEVIPCKDCTGELAAAPDGSIIVGVENRGLVICRNGKVEHFWGEMASDPRQQMYLGLVNSLQFDPAGQLWFGTRRGVWHYDGKTFTQYDTGSSALRASINYNIAFDTDGTMWTAGYPPKNLCRYRDSVWDEFQNIGEWMVTVNGDAPAYRVLRVIALQGGGVLVSAQFKVAIAIYRNGLWSQPWIPPALDSATLWPTVVDRRGRVWMRITYWQPEGIGVWGGLAVYDPALDHPRVDSTVPPPVQLVDPAHRLFIPGEGTPGRE